MPVLASIALLHIVGWSTLIAFVAPAHPSTGGAAFGIGIGLTAYMLGVRHAFDADHIAAIDNTTRKLMQEGRRPMAVGFWFSCGHSSVVFLLTALLAAGTSALSGPLRDEGSDLHRFAGLVGPLVSGGFLLAIAALNIVVLAELWATFRRMRSGSRMAVSEPELERGGLVTRFVTRVAGVVTRPRQMYAVGLLFGLGFDTATEIGLLVLATSGAASGLPWYAILCLPILFAAGMSLFDTLQGSFMTAAYGWALAQPVRRIYYNLVITGLSVAVALIIGTIEVAGLLSERLNWHGVFWDAVSAVDLNAIGFVVTALFVATWLGALLIWKLGRIEHRGQRAIISTVIDSGGSNAEHPTRPLDVDAMGTCGSRRFEPETIFSSHIRLRAPIYKKTKSSKGIIRLSTDKNVSVTIDCRQD